MVDKSVHSKPCRFGSKSAVLVCWRVHEHGTSGWKQYDESIYWGFKYSACMDVHDGSLLASLGVRTTFDTLLSLLTGSSSRHVIPSAADAQSFYHCYTHLWFGLCFVQYNRDHYLLSPGRRRLAAVTWLLLLSVICRLWCVQYDFRAFGMGFVWKAPSHLSSLVTKPPSKETPHPLFAFALAPNLHECFLYHSRVSTTLHEPLGLYFRCLWRLWVLSRHRSHRLMGTLFARFPTNYAHRLLQYCALGSRSLP